MKSLSKKNGLIRQTWWRRWRDLGAVLIPFLLFMFLADRVEAEPPPAPLDLNRATVSELMQLPGVGVVRARDIVQFRRRRPFQRPSDLLRIRGIGRRTYKKLKPLVRVGPVPRT